MLRATPAHGSTTAVPYALKAHRRELIDPKIIEYGGRIVKTTGDGLLLNSLAWWTRYVVPLMCSVEWPNAMRRLAPDQRIEFALASILATSSLMAMTSLAMASTSRREFRGLRNWWNSREPRGA